MKFNSRYFTKSNKSFGKFMENQFSNKYYSKYFATKINAQNLINYFQTQNLIQNFSLLKNSNTFLFSLPQTSESCLSFYQSSIDGLSKKLSLLFGLEQIRLLSSLGLVNQGKFI
jgi:hypothetical protein